MHVPAGDDKGLTFEAEPDEGTPAGNYEFRISAKTPDGKFKMSETVMVTVKAGEAEKKESKGVKLTTSYPVIRVGCHEFTRFCPSMQDALEV